MVTPEGEVIQARGEVHGELLRAPAGEGGFGYDPIFYYPPYGKTLAEVSAEEKNAVSHRANALKVFYEKMKEAGYADK
jgi:XTP/dITP diphosphohydrolase